jgi:hypothetical protein
MPALFTSTSIGPAVFDAVDESGHLRSISEVGWMRGAAEISGELLDGVGGTRDQSDVRTRSGELLCKPLADPS